ncbi:hypothetical protein [Methylobacterium sp. SyP6R]|uniref:hypothetical protein n=1 Tax=Methylobacterium sp. SyP6R TaxID=2718876 RepID=UPI001F28D2CE|nr:hypothetical protein [Methylobacterium sp. SyP6R]MCF4124292.1 hypothetical protein [Methylobacterium sp. SyP6R]
MARYGDTRLPTPVARLVRPPASPQSPADRLAEHLIEAYRSAADCEDPVALDLIRLALWHVGRTYPPSGHIPEEQRREEHWS